MLSRTTDRVTYTLGVLNLLVAAGAFWRGEYVGAVVSTVLFVVMVVCLESESRSGP